MRLAIAACIGIMAYLPRETWICSGVRWALGLVLYAARSVRSPVA